MYLGLQPNPRATARKVDKFLTTEFQRYLNLAGLHRNQLTSPQLSFAPGSTNKNGVEDNFIDDIYSKYNIKRVEANRMINSKGNSRGKINELLICNY